MRDRVPTKPNRYAVYDDSHNFIRYEYHERADEPTEGGTPINKANLLKDATAALYGLGTNAVPDEVFAAANGIMTKNLINILRLKLRQSLKANDIDAWSDLLADASGINTGASSGYAVSDGALAVAKTPGSSISWTSEDANVSFGTSSVSIYGQTFTTSSATNVGSVTVKLSKNGSPTDNVVCKIYSMSGANPSTLLYTSSNVVSGATITSSMVSYTFNFSGAALNASTVYYFSLERSGALDASNYYFVRYYTAGGYSGGSVVRYLPETGWQALSSDLYFVITTYTYSGTATVIWNAVTPTEALTMMAITADQTVGTGSITWYLSDDGTNWTQITSLDTMQSVNFDVANVRLKCVLTSNAEVRAVAWGGY